MVVIFGNTYTFTPHELARLERKFRGIEFIDCLEGDCQGSIGALQSTIEAKPVSLVVFNLPSAMYHSAVEALSQYKIEKNIKFKNLQRFMNKYLHKCYISEIVEELQHLEEIRPFSRWQYLQKRAVDIFGVSMLLLFSWPVIFWSHRKIKKQSPGPVLYKQPRVGANGKEFLCTKLRSMRLDAEKEGIKFASKNDDRIFPWGETMRKTRLDELPQMINILKGEMHLIGPRPERLHWTTQFEKSIPHYNARHHVAPGITGWAQVMYPYGENEEDAKQKLMYDLYYIKHWSIWLELKIVWKTALTVIGKHGV